MTEQSDAPEIVASKDDHCEYPACKDLAVYRCHTCARLFCIEHSSEIDPVRFCTECMKIDDCNVIEMPLLDKEGVRHKGRILRPVGRAFIENNKLISDLSDEELKTFIVDYQRLLHEAESITNLYRISLTQATHTALDREIIKLKPSGEAYFPTLSPHEKKEKKSKTPTKSGEDRLLAAMAKAGVTPDMIAKIIEQRKAKKAV